MRFYTQQRPFYCGIDLHARSLYACIADDSGNTCLHKEIKAAPEPLLALLTTYLGQIVIGVRTIHGIGRILALAILYEVGDVGRFDTVQQFASYGRLVKCKAESAGKNYGTQGNKIGNAHLKWAFSEAVVCHLRGNPKAQAYLEKLQRRMSKGKALSVLAHKLGRCVYFMLKNQQVFDEQRFLG